MKRTGIKRGNKPLQAHKPMAKQSPKRKQYRASEARTEAVAHMMRVKALPCVCCGAPPPSEAHHCRSDGTQRDDYLTIPLCKNCHTGPDGYHGNKRAWHERHGPDYGFVRQVEIALGIPLALSAVDKPRKA